MNSPAEIYQRLCTTGELKADVAQQAAITELDRLYLALGGNGPTYPKQGIYLWGDVGRGKTKLMDIFYSALPDGMAQRAHFHHFMARLHRELNLAFGQANPLLTIADRLASEYRVLCFDEFFVSDIGDAMLLGGIVGALLDRGVIIVATSNIAIEGLFQSQLQKDRFQPTIARMSQAFSSIHLSGEVDHRFQPRPTRPIYFTDKAGFAAYLQGATLSPIDTLSVNRRSIKAQGSNDQQIWFRFEDLCIGPRAAADYMELASQFDEIIVSDIPCLSGEAFEHIKARGTEDGAVGSGQTGDRAVSLAINDDAVRRFISLVDECYDQRVRLVLQAEVSFDQLYQAGTLLFEFRRTQSRLTEMAHVGFGRLLTFQTKDRDQADT
ncbi:AFG1 family ATPase [Maribrevibacterium harenarium]|uniref:AFG1 family ATPase n=1 Tax=Maribrevibacterium harenarium TaxID=2589817 RepID=A0A501WCT1_9GAMM|nr:cell division protein ZapE [Maribrevibacterium harenarium]TPE47198.1 AFG1 family ATPase [Maribrevibacterium harenarium]